MSIVVENITKVYGEQKALDNVSFRIAKGEIVGFLGPNGAGKSTMMKILTTFLKATSGSAAVNAFDTSSETRNVQKSVGYLPEHNPLYLDMHVREYLAFNANVYKISKSRIDEVIEMTGLSPESHKKIGELSKGFRQRVGLHEVVADTTLAKLQKNQLQVIEVEFDYRVEDVLLEQLPHVTQIVNTHGLVYEITFDTSKDMRSTVFDFAHDNSLKALQINQKNKNLESLFKELTA